MNKPKDNTREAAEEPIAYRLVEWKKPTGITTAAVAACSFCGKCLSGMGGGCFLLCAQCVHDIVMQRVEPSRDREERKNDLNLDELYDIVDGIIQAKDKSFCWDNERGYQVQLLAERINKLQLDPLSALLERLAERKGFYTLWKWSGISLQRCHVGKSKYEKAMEHGEYDGWYRSPLEAARASEEIGETKRGN